MLETILLIISVFIIVLVLLQSNKASDAGQIITGGNDTLFQNMKERAFLFTLKLTSGATITEVNLPLSTSDGKFPTFASIHYHANAMVLNKKEFTQQEAFNVLIMNVFEFETMQDLNSYANRLRGLIIDEYI